jgi:flagellar basal-body rod modification protein FlgD
MTTTTSTAAAPTSSTIQSNLVAGQQNLASNFNTFLQLLTTQLQNQDPTSPMDPNAFTQQIVEMTGVQQQLLSNQLLQQLVTAQNGGVANDVSLIGKTVTAQSSSAVLTGGQVNWAYNLPSSATEASLTVSDASGQVVWSGAAPALGAGQHGFTWNGKNSYGQQLADGGTYTLSVTADASGASMTPSIYVQGVATAVTQSNGQSQVSIGSTQVPVSSITEVSSQ